jgi:lysozyme family protein
MKANFDKCLALVLKHEGGFVNHPKDPGGMTNLGVTKTTWEEWTGNSSDEAEMRSLTPEMVAPLYKARFWDRVKADELPSGVDYAVFDAAVNSGPGRAARWLQECVGVAADGAIGPKTLQAVNSYPGDLQSDYCDKRLKFLQSLPTFPTFGRGWTRRVEDVKSTRLL